MARLIFFLGLLTFSNACWPIEDLNPNGGSTLSVGTSVSFTRGEAKVMVKPSAKGDVKLGLYLKDEAEDTVAGVTFHQVNISLFISFYEQHEGVLTKVFTQFVDMGQLFLKPHTWASITVSHLDDVMKVTIFTERYWKMKTVRGLVRTQHRLPLRIYAKALLGPVFSTIFHYPGDVVIDDTASSYRGDSQFSNVYIIPDQDFRLANVILQINGNHVVFNLTSDDLIPGQCNRLKYQVRKDRAGATKWLEIYLPEARRCTRFIEEQLIEHFDEGYMVANAPVRMVFAKGNAIYSYGAYYNTIYKDNIEMKTVALPLCDSEEETECRVQRIGISNHSSELVPLGNRVDYAVKPQAIVSGRIFNFGIWLQELGHLLAGVQIVQEGDNDVQLSFYQVLNDSYKLKYSQSFSKVKLDPKNVTFVFLTYTGNEFTVGLKTSSEGQWYKSKTTMTLENQAPLSAFLWSREDLIIASNCLQEDIHLNLLRRNGATSSPKLHDSAIFRSDVFFLPTYNFKVGARVTKDSYPGVLHIKVTDVVLGKWNHISTTYLEETYITMPAQDFCPIMVKQSYDTSGFVYSNPDTEWFFEKPPPELGCFITMIGFEGMELFNFEDNQVTFWPNSHGFEARDLLLMTLSDGPHRLAFLRVTNNDTGYFLVSEELGFKGRITDSRDHFPVKISLRHKQDGRMEFTSWIAGHTNNVQAVWGRNPDVSFTSGKTLPALTEEYALTYTFINRESSESPRFKILAIDDSKTSIIFRSPLNWTTSLMFYLRDANGTDEGSLHVVHGSSANGIRVVYTGEGLGPRSLNITDITVQTNQWVELTLQILGNVLKIGLRTRKEPTWRSLEFVTKKLYSHPLLAVIESLHQHDVILNCKREDRQFAVADDPSPSSLLLVAPHASQQVEMARAHLVMTVTSGHVPVGQRSTILVWALRTIDFVLFQFSHVNGGMSTITLKQLYAFGVLQIYLDNTDENEGVTRMEVLTFNTQRKVFSLSSHGPVENIRVFSTQDSFWLFNSCDHVHRQAVNHTTVPQQAADHNTDGVIEMVAFPGNSALFFWTKHGSNAIVYLYHENGNISIRETNKEMTSGYVIFLQLHNVLDEKSFAYMTGASGELERLDHTGPVRNVTVVLHYTEGYIVLLLEACQAK